MARVTLQVNRSPRLIYVETEDLLSESVSTPYVRKRIMKQLTVELLKNISIHHAYGEKIYPKGIHTLDQDVAKMLIRCKSARYVIPHRSVLASKQSKH